MGWCYDKCLSELGQLRQLTFVVSECFGLLLDSEGIASESLQKQVDQLSSILCPVPSNLPDILSSSSAMLEDHDTDWYIWGNDCQWVECVVNVIIQVITGMIKVPSTFDQHTYTFCYPKIYRLIIYLYTPLPSGWTRTATSCGSEACPHRCFQQTLNLEFTFELFSGSGRGSIMHSRCCLQLAVHLHFIWGM